MVFVLHFQTILLVYEYTINIDSSRNQISKKPYWHDILNDSSIFEAKINNGNYNLDASTLKLLPMILKALNNNLIFDNEIDDSSPTPVADKTDSNDDSYLQNHKNTFTNWLKIPNTIDYRPHYKSPTNLDYYSKIRKIRNYQKVLSLFDKMVNNKMSVTSSEIMVEQLTDKPKSSKDSKEYKKKKSTYSTRYYSSTPRRVIMIRKVPQLTTIKKKTTVTKQHETINTKGKKCSCPKNLRILLGKLVHNIQEILPELTLMVKVPCNDTSNSVTSGPSIRSTSTPATRRTSISTTEASSTSIEDNDVIPAQSITVSTIEPLTTIFPRKYSMSLINNNKPKKHIEIEPNNNIYLGVSMQKLNIKPGTKKMLTLEKRKNFHNSSTKSKKMYIDTTEIFAIPNVFTTPLVTLPVSITMTTISPTTTTITTSVPTTTSAVIVTTTPATRTTSKTSRTSVKVTNTSTKIDQNIKVPKTIAPIKDISYIADEDDGDEYYLTTPQEEDTISSSSYLPQELSDFNPYILELIKSNILRSRPIKKKLASKEPNTYIDQVIENSSIQQANDNEESKEEFNINTPEQPSPNIVENYHLEKENMRTNELIFDLPGSIDAYQQTSDGQQTEPTMKDHLNIKYRHSTTPSLEKNLIDSILDKDLKKKTTNYISKYTTINYQELTKKYEQLNTFQSPNSNNNFNISNSTVTRNHDKVKVETTIFRESTTDETKMVEKDDPNNYISQEFSLYEGLSRKEGMLKGNDLIAYKNLAKKASDNDRKSSPLSNPKGETQNKVNNYMNWLENVGHPVNVMTSNWMDSVASSSESQKNNNIESPWYIKKKSTEYNEKSSMQTDNNNFTMVTDKINNEPQKVTATTWSYDMFSEDNKTFSNCPDKEENKIEIEMPDSEILMPVQEIPLSKYLGSSLLPEKFSKNKDKFPNEHFVDNSPSILSSMLPHNRPIYLEIARRDWKKDVKEYDLSKETYTDIF